MAVLFASGGMIQAQSDAPVVGASTAPAAATSVPAESGGFVPSCPVCIQTQAHQAQQRAFQTTHRELLVKNNDYLAKLDANDTSKAIKVKSNIVIIQLRLETMENEINSAAFYLATHGCVKCK